MIGCADMPRGAAMPLLPLHCYVVILVDLVETLAE